MGLDIGKARIGVALSCPLGMIAQPFEVLDRRRVNPIKRIEQLIQEYDVRTLVVGEPLTLAGAQGLSAQSVHTFLQTLKLHIDVPVVWWDERLSTAQAQRMMIEDNVRRQKRRQQIDKVAAALILQSYLDAKIR